MADITLAGLSQVGGRYKSGNIIVPPTTDTEFLFDAAYRPSNSPFTARAYWPDVSNKYLVQNWNTAYPGLEWEQPFYAYGMNGPVLYEIVEAPTGMTMSGRFVRDPVTGFFKYEPAVLSWQNHVAGSYRIAIQATGQTSGQRVSWVFTLNVNASLNFFMALNATGDGSGSSPSNYASWVSTIIGQNTVSPCKGKVLRIKGDEFPVNANLRPDVAYTSASWCAMPAETPVFLQKFNLGGNDLSFQKIKFEGVGTSNFGVISSSGIQNRIGVWGVEFNECYMVGESGANQSCIGFNASGTGFGREGIFVGDCKFINSETIHGVDYYNIKDNVFVGNELIINNGATSMMPSWVFPKVQADGCEIMYNKADIPSITLTDQGVFQINNGWEPSYVNVYNMSQRVENNFIRTGGANTIRVNADNDPALSPNTLEVHVKRNTFIGGRVRADNADAGGNTERMAYFESNVIINPDGGIITPESYWMVVSGTNTFGTAGAGLVDANGSLVSPTNWGKSGNDIWSPE